MVTSKVKFFGFSTGLRQGDPLASMLFILVMEALSRMMHNVVFLCLYVGEDVIVDKYGITEGGWKTRHVEPFGYGAWTNVLKEWDYFVENISF